MNTTTVYRVTYYLGDDVTAKIRLANVSVTEGYTTVESIPKILAVKHYSRNDDASVANIRIISQEAVAQGLPTRLGAGNHGRK